jgi:hypothetical protein
MNNTIQEGTFKFTYTEEINNTMVENSLVIKTKDVVRSIGKFGENKTLADLQVRQLNINKH